MNKALIKTLEISAATAVLALFAYAAQAQAPKPKEPAKKPPACNSLKDESACKARTDCQWVSAVVDEKTKKEKRKAYCRTAPKPPAKKEEPKKK